MSDQVKVKETKQKETKEKRLCELCGKPLKKIGVGRKNGKIHFEDWKNRKFHVKCYKAGYNYFK